VGVKTQFTRSPGKLGKYLKPHLEPELWALLQQTYADASYEHTWEALDAMCTLFRMTAIQVATQCGFTYALGDDEKVTGHLHHVRRLPKQATAID
jgi:aminoglycoside 6-adenylyltransferase